MSGFYTQVDVHYFVDKHSVNISTTVCTALASLSISDDVRCRGFEYYYNSRLAMQLRLQHLRDCENSPEDVSVEVALKQTKTRTLVLTNIVTQNTERR